VRCATQGAEAERIDRATIEWLALSPSGWAVLEVSIALSQAVRTAPGLRVEEGGTSLMQVK
jgi:hypothetical protein